jgi:hypothetical protein
MKSDVVRKIGFTGSTPVGKILMKQAADTVKKVRSHRGAKALAFERLVTVVACSSHMRPFSCHGHRHAHHITCRVPSSLRVVSICSGTDARFADGGRQRSSLGSPSRTGQTRLNYPGSATTLPLPFADRCRLLLVVRSAWSWAATRPSSCSTTPMWSWRPRASCPPPSATPARPASAPTAPSFRCASCARPCTFATVVGARGTSVCWLVGRCTMDWGTTSAPWWDASAAWLPTRESAQCTTYSS